MRPARCRPTRHGSLLVIVAGVSATLATLGLAFVIRMRSDAADSVAAEHHAQARIMLMAALLYVQEAGRIGWDADPAQPARVRPDGSLDLSDWRRNPDETRSEGFGWVDVRDGFMGPKPTAYTQDDLDRMDQEVSGAAPPTQWPGLVEAARRYNDGRGVPSTTPLSLREKQRWTPSPWFPVGTVMRAPMAVMERPPFAIAPIIAPNAVRTTASFPATTTAATDFGRPFLRHPDPQPAPIRLEAGAASSVNSDAAYALFRSDDPRPRPRSYGRGWFRVYRDGPATFVITVGSGGSLGYRTWNEVDDVGREAFANDPTVFAEAVATEIRLWYRVEWNGGINVNIGNQHYQGSMNGMAEAFNAYQIGFAGWGRSGIYPQRVNALGSIQWIQRLPAPPLAW